MDQTFAMRVFLKVVEEGSFSKAAERMGITQSSASRNISALEQELDVQLLQRSTRKLNLSEAGRIYFERAGQIIADLDDAHLALKHMNSTPSGLLRVAAPAAFGLRQIAPLLGEFHAQYPEVKIGLSLNDGVEDFLGGGFDLAIRFGKLSDSALIASQLATSHSVICASPAYLKRAGEPQNPDELEEHNCLTFRTSPGHNSWNFEAQGKTKSVPVSGSLYADNADALLQAAISGLGVIQLPVWMVASEIKKGSLEPVLTGFDLLPKTSPIHAVFAHREHLAAKIRVFIGFLKDNFKTNSW